MSRCKIYDFLPHNAIILYTLGLNSVKLCFANHVLWFGTAKSYIFPKFSFFLFFPPSFPFPISKPFDLPPPRREGGKLNYIQAWIYQELQVGLKWETNFDVTPGPKI